MDSPLIVGLAVFALVIGAGALPLLFRLSPRTLHGVVALASGFFLGVTFLHLLPEIANEAATQAADPAHHEASIVMLMWGAVLVGMLAVFFAEVLLRHDEPGLDDDHAPHSHGHLHGHGHAHARGAGHAHAHAAAPAPAAAPRLLPTLPTSPFAPHDHPAHHAAHRVVGIATFVGLAVHTFGGALGIGLAFDRPEVREVLVSATLSHKAAEAFSLVSVLLLAELSRRSIVALLAAYALVTPIGIAIGRLFASRLPAHLLGLAEGLAAGTFLYVAVAELLPEVFHGRRDRGLKILLLLSGIALAAFLFRDHAAGLHEH